MTNTALSPEEKYRQSKHIARMTYLAIILIFLSVCSVAVFATMQMEKEKSGFKAIHLSKPISFFDYTYVDNPSAPKTNHTGNKKRSDTND